MQPPSAPIPSSSENIFAALFPHPTGTNGYEDLAQACDVILRSTSLALFSSDQAQPTLAQVRKALANPDAKNALELCRAGLSKTILSPHIETVELAAFPEFAPVCVIGRLLARMIQVEFGTGNAQSAIEWIDLGMRFSHAIQQRYLESRIMGTYCETLVLDRAVELIDALSKYDCIKLLHAIQNRLSQPNPNPRIVREEYDYAKRILTKSKENPGALKEILGDSEAYDENDKAILEQLRNEPDATRKAADEALDQWTAMLDHAVKDAGLLPWQRTPFFLPPELSSEAAFFIRSNIPQNLDREVRIPNYDRNEASLRILATRVLLRTYRWEHDRYPATLSSFQEKSLTEDPFSGKPLQYVLKGDGFELFSIGPHRIDENGASMKERTPLYLPRRI